MSEDRRKRSVEQSATKLHAHNTTVCEVRACVRVRLLSFIAFRSFCLTIHYYACIYHSVIVTVRVCVCMSVCGAWF